MRPTHHQMPSGGSLNRINVTENRHNSNIYGTINAGSNPQTNLINLSKSLENHNMRGLSQNADRRYAESLWNLKKKEKQNRETI